MKKLTSKPFPACAFVFCLFLLWMGGCEKLERGWTMADRSGPETRSAQTDRKALLAQIMAGAQEFYGTYVEIPAVIGGDSLYGVEPLWRKALLYATQTDRVMTVHVGYCQGSGLDIRMLLVYDGFSMMVRDAYFLKVYPTQEYAASHPEGYNPYDFSGRTELFDLLGRKINDHTAHSGEWDAGVILSRGPNELDPVIVTLQRCPMCGTTYGVAYFGCPKGCTPLDPGDPWGDPPGGGPSGPPTGGGGPSTPPTQLDEVLVYAQKVFRNSTMSPDTWKKVGEMLLKIRKDSKNCMAEAMYNELVNKLGDKRLLLVYDPSAPDSGFDASESKIILNKLESPTLFHEMWHALQAYYETEATWVSADLNLEIEAWVATYLYVQSLSKTVAVPTWQGYFEKNYGLAAADIGNALTPAGNLNTKVCSEECMKNLILYARDAFRNAPEYGRGHPFDSNRTGSANLKNIQRLSKNCK